MKFYTKLHQYYCGADLHNNVDVSLNHQREKGSRSTQNIDAKPDIFKQNIQSFSPKIIVGI